MILLKNPMNASTRLSTNGKSPMISHAPPFVLRLSKDERKVFQQNQISRLTPAYTGLITSFPSVKPDTIPHHLSVTERQFPTQVG